MTITYPAYDDERLQKIKEDSYKLLQPGEYEFKVLDATEGTSKSSGNPMVTLDLAIYDEMGEMYNVKDYLVVIEKMIYKFKHFWESVGMPHMYGLPLEADQLKNLSGKLRTKMEEQEVERKDGLGKQKMKFIRVEDYIKSDRQVSTRNLTSSGQRSYDSEDDDVPF